MKIICFHCKKETVTDKVGRRDECVHCGSDMHVCRNCEHFDEKVYNSCKEHSADVVKEKDRSNFCDHFFPTSDIKNPGQAKQDLLAQAESLFKKK